MASICPYPGRKCIGCQHRRIDEDLGAYACFVKQDLKAAAAPQPGVVETRRYEEEEQIRINSKTFSDQEDWKELCKKLKINPEEAVEVELCFGKARIRR